jgi:uncharacterized protein YecE (DUF72 family)
LPIVATAAWSVPKSVADSFPREGSVLERYAAVFEGVEINSTFYRRHKPETFARWAGSVPDGFLFAVKMPKEITHARRLKNIDEQFALFLDDVSHLGGKLGPLLCQLPPNLAFDREVAEPALASMRERHPGQIVIEPRHPTWASEDVLELLESSAIDRVLADPPVIWTASDFAEPPRYVRLHGKPKIYYSAYSEDEIRSFRQLVAPDGWCVFDNTASGAATEDALAMLALTGAQNVPRKPSETVTDI